MLNRSRLLPLLLLTWLVSLGVTPAAQGQSAVDDEGRTVQFARDIAPILTARCWDCHHGQNAKNGFLVDDADTVLDFIAAGNAADSILYNEYLITTDDDLLMPPPSHGGPMSPAELALIRVWIDEGADWPTGAVVGPEAGDDPSTKDDASETSPGTAIAPAAAASLPTRLWLFQGFFHPAVVHFPIALLIVGGLFVIVGFWAPQLGNHVALTCLYLGTFSALLASIMGWSFAAQAGYGSWTKVDFDSDVFWHRWSGIVVTVLAVLVSIIACRAGHGSNRRRIATAGWKTGLLLLSVLIALVGHQGGHLTFGAGHYQRAFEILRGPSATSEPAAAPANIDPTAAPAATSTEH